MSGAEALFVLGLVANIAGVTDVTLKTLGRIKDARDESRGLPKAFQDVKIMLPMLKDTLSKTRGQIEQGTVSEESCKNVEPVLRDCFVKVKELELILEECLAKDNASWFEREWKALLSLRQDKKIEEISSHIWRLIPLLTYHHVASPPVAAKDPVSTSFAALSSKTQQCYLNASTVLGNCFEHFTGREEVLSAIISKLDQPRKYPRVSIVGLGGIGKSRLAMEITKHYTASNISIFWIHAGTADRMREGSRDIAEALGIPGCDDPNADILKMVQNWLQSQHSGRWLLVYDNVDDIELMYPENGKGLARYFPRSDHGSILMTTRNKQIGNKFAGVNNTHRLNALSNTESLELLTLRLGENNLETQSRKRLAETLEGIPLALVQASAFIQENEITLDRYLALYDASDRDKIQLLSSEFEDDTRHPDLKNPIATTWAVTFEYLKKRWPLAADTLCLMSMFDTRAIPEAFIQETAQGDPPTATNVELALSTLRSYSLITKNDAAPGNSDRSFNLHRLVRLSTMKWLMLSSSYEFWLAEAIVMLSGKYDKLKDADHDTDWKLSSNYLPHALNLMASPCLRLLDDNDYVPQILQQQAEQTDHTGKGRVSPSCTANILTEMLSRNKSWLQRLRMIRKAVAISSSALGSTHILTLHHRSEEAKASWRVEESTHPDLAFRSVLKDYTSTLGPGHIATLRTQRLLAETLNDQGNLSEAEEILRNVIDLCSQEHGEHHQVTIEAMQSLSTNMSLQNRRKEALTLNERIMPLAQSPTTKYKLSKQYLSIFEYTKTESLCWQLLMNKDALKRDDYVSVDKVWQTLAKVYRKQKMYDKAEQILLQTLAYRRNVYGENSLVTLYTKLYLADTFYHQARYPEAESILLLAIDPLTSHFGELNSEVLDVRWDLAWTWLKQGKMAESRKLASEVVALALKSRGDQHQQSISMIEDLRNVWGADLDGTSVGTEVDGLGERRNWRELERARPRSVDGFHHDLDTLR